MLVRKIDKTGVVWFILPEIKFHRNASLCTLEFCPISAKNRLVLQSTLIRYGCFCPKYITLFAWCMKIGSCHCLDQLHYSNILASLHANACSKCDTEQFSIWIHSELMIVLLMYCTHKHTACFHVWVLTSWANTHNCEIKKKRHA